MSAPDASRLAALQLFDDSKTGVKGLVESGITTLPPIFIHPTVTTQSPPSVSLSIPTVDLSLPRSEAVDLIRSAAGSFGFFHLTNHSLPLPVISRALSAVRSFNDLPSAARSSHYSRDFSSGVCYSSNFDLFHSPAASWRDTIQIQFAPTRPDTTRIPGICRDELVDFDAEVAKVGEVLLELLAEGLGVDKERLKMLTCHEGRYMVCHYYPWCPEPERTQGIGEHSDRMVVTVLVQDSIGGLQVKCEEGWVDVVPVEDALVINIGDLLQIISNDEYKSVEHRVVANSNREGRVSIGVFFYPRKREESDLYGPLHELVSQEKPAIYRNFTLSEFIGAYSGKPVGISPINCFKL